MRAIVSSVFVMLVAARVFAQGFGGGAAPAPKSAENCIPPAVVEALRARTPAARQSPQVTLFTDPMGAGGMNSFGKTVVNYVDRDPSTAWLDWNCGTNTYDGHAGVDIEIRDFVDMDAGVPILCAAAGTVIHTHDGEYDRRTGWINGVVANDVVVQHPDGSSAYYWHMRKGSVRPTVGQPVAAGDTLGFVGSSGFSSGPHLHFEVYSTGTRDPFTGACQPNAGWWNAQQPYVWTYPVQLFNSGSTTMRVIWPTICERPPSKTHVVAGSTLYTWIRARNLSTTDIVTYRYFSSQGPWDAVSFSPTRSFSSSWWYVGWTLPVNASLYGPWRIEISINGVLQATHHFNYDATPNQLPVVSPRTVLVAANGSADVDLAALDPDGSVFLDTLLTNASHGLGELGGVRFGRLHYAAALGFTGLDSVTVAAFDDEGAQGAPATIRFAVGSVTDAPAPVHGALTLAAPTPNPVRGDAAIAFTLPFEAGATLELLDVSGRRLGAWSPGRLAAGEHRVALSTLTAGQDLAPGLFFLRLRAGDDVATRRVSVAR